MTARVVALVALVCASVACHLTINESNTNNNTSTSSGNPNGPSNPANPNPTPSPTPGGTGTRTPDPAPGQTLPFPTYTAGVVSQITVPVSQSCTTFGFLDAVVDALRTHDTRWGYACSSSGCGAPSLDNIAYHATAGPEIVGATGNYLVDLIVDVCGVAPRLGFDARFDPVAGWTSRGRF